MSPDSSDETPDPSTPPSLRKAPDVDLPAPADEPAPLPREPHALAEPDENESIWQPLDGSVPRIDGAPTYGAPQATGASLFSGRAGGQTPPPHRVAAAYAQVAQAATTFTLANWWSRCWAFLIDSALFGAIVVGLTLVAGTAAGMSLEQAANFFASATIPAAIHDPGWLYAVLVVGRLVLGILPALFLWRWNGQTPGKRLLGIRVMRASGEPLTLRIALRREVLARVVLLQLSAIVTLGIGPLVNYLWPLWDAQRRAGHDLYADTRVVVETKKKS